MSSTDSSYKVWTDLAGIGSEWKTKASSAWISLEVPKLAVTLDRLLTTHGSIKVSERTIRCSSLSSIVFQSQHGQFTQDLSSFLQNYAAFVSSKLTKTTSEWFNPFLLPRRWWWTRIFSSTNKFSIRANKPRQAPKILLLNRLCISLSLLFISRIKNRYQLVYCFLCSLDLLASSFFRFEHSAFWSVIRHLSKHIGLIDTTISEIDKQDRNNRSEEFSWGEMLAKKKIDLKAASISIVVVVK